MLNKEDVVNTKGFYQLPKFLFKEEKYKKLSTEAKTVYALFIDRLKISIKNKWLDENNNVYIIFTNEEVRKELNCCIATAIKVVKELKNCGLITTKRQGLGKPNLVYIQKVDVLFECIEKNKPKTKATTISEPNSIENTENYEISESIVEENEISTVSAYEEILKENISYEYFVKNQNQKEAVDEILEIMLEVMTSNKKEFKLSKEKTVLTELFKSKVMKINSSHIEYILNSLENTTSKIINMKSYLLTSLFNATATINNYYSNWVRSDFANGYT